MTQTLYFREGTSDKVIARFITGNFPDWERVLASLDNYAKAAKLEAKAGNSGYCYEGVEA